LNLSIIEFLLSVYTTSYGINYIFIASITVFILDNYPDTYDYLVLYSFISFIQTNSPRMYILDILSMNYSENISM